MARFDESKVKILRHVGDVEVNNKEIRVQIIQYGSYEPSITCTRLFKRSSGELGYGSIGSIKIDEMKELIPLFTEASNDLQENFNKYNMGEKSKKGIYNEI